MKESSNLDVLRSIAVGLVVLSHLRFFLGLPATMNGYSFDTLGHLGVAMFFVHTTLVLMLSMDRHGPAAGPFFIRRFFRIYPLAAFMVILTALMTLRWGGQEVTLGVIVSNLLLIQNLTGHISIPGPLWSLPAEVQMYLVLPALYAVTRLSRPVLRVALLCGGLLACGLVASVLSPERVAISPFQYVPCFLPGVLAFVLRGRVTPSFGLPALLLFIGTSILTVPIFVAAGLPETPLLWVVCLALGVTIPMCQEMTNRTISAAAKTVATYSYGIYLTHMLALWLGFAGMKPYGVTAQWGVFVFMLAGLSYAAYHGIEKRGIRLGARLSNRQVNGTSREATI
jgi:peptidoglycan/LPS O-acetylase OafA/YrhL